MTQYYLANLNNPCLSVLIVGFKSLLILKVHQKPLTWQQLYELKTSGDSRIACESPSVCSVGTAKKSHLLLHSRSFTQCSITSPYFTGESAECAVMLQQFGSSHYWDRLVRAVKICISNPRNWLHIFPVYQPQAESVRRFFWRRTDGGPPPVLNDGSNFWTFA